MPGFDPVRDRALDAIIRLYRAGSLGGGGVSDGDYGDVVVTVGGTVWTLDAGVVAAFTPILHVGSGGGAHANVVASGAAGFMTGADKAKLDSISGGLTSGTAEVNFGAFPGSYAATIVRRDGRRRASGLGQPRRICDPDHTRGASVPHLCRWLHRAMARSIGILILPLSLVAILR